MTNLPTKSDAYLSSKQGNDLELLDTGPCGALSDTQLERIKQAYTARAPVKIIGSSKTFLRGQLD